MNTPIEDHQKVRLYARRPSCSTDYPIAEHTGKVWILPFRTI